MSAMLTTLLLFEKYGPRMSLEQMGDALGLATGTLYQRHLLDAVALLEQAADGLVP